MIGIVVAVWLGERRWVARGGRPGDVLDIAIWAVPFGIVGARAYHLITDWDKYFAAGREPLEALRIWEGGLSIWGAIAAGVLGGWIGAKRKGLPFPALADAVAPGIVLAQAIGRIGNYFNNELYGRPTDLPWGLEVHQMRNFEAVRDASGDPVLVDGGPFHPIFLYESLWAVGTALVLIWADRRFRMGHGRVFALYVALYTAGRTWIENLRIDDGGDVAGPAREFLGMRINAWVSVLLFVGAIVYIVVSARLKPGRETVELPPLEEEAEVTAEATAKDETSEMGEVSETADEDAPTTADKAADGDGDTVVDEPATADVQAAEDTEGDEDDATEVVSAPTAEPDADSAEPVSDGTESDSEAEPETKAEAPASAEAEAADETKVEAPASSEPEDAAPTETDSGAVSDEAAEAPEPQRK
jgi:prolipoprotein diacylglyceryl transferase